MSELALVQRRVSADLDRSRAASGVRDLGRALTRARTGLAGVQARLLVGPTHDPLEREADRMADAVTQGRMLGTSLLSSTAPVRVAQRAVGKGESDTKKDEKKKDEDERDRRVQKVPSGQPGTDLAPVGIEAGVVAMLGGGAPLDASLRRVFEPRFGYDFSQVRVHTGPSAAGAASALGARAFTLGQNVFFGAGEYQPASPSGRHLIAHELTHTIQQSSSDAPPSRLLRVPPRVQRWEGPIDRIRNRIGDFLTQDFPPWELITLIVGRDPVRDRPVKGATRDWIHAAMKLAPDGQALFDRLDKEGQIEAVARWWDGEVARLNLSLDGLLTLVRRAWDALSVGDVTDPVGAWNTKIKPIFEPVVQRVWTFIKNVATKIFQVLRDVILKQIGDWAKKQQGYPLLTMILGRDPVTGEAVTPTLKGVIFAVLDLVPGGEPIKENLEKSKAVEKAAAWFKAETKKLNLTWEGIKLVFSQAWDAFKVSDLLNPKLLLEKMSGVFGPFVTKLVAFLGVVARKLLELIFEGAMMIAGPVGLQIVGIVRKIGATFQKIVGDPVAFVRHLVDAVKKGIQQFGANIWEHLKTGVIRWLVGALEGAGLVLPKVWDVRGILDLTLQVLGITYPKVRVKLVKVIGEKTMAMLEKAFAFVKALVTEGPAAAWREIVEAIGSLWDMVIGGIKDWAVGKIVTAAITKLATMFNPVGAVIQAIIATYNTIAFFIERIKQIVDFVEAVVDSIANIAEGKIAQAANYVESAMARSIPVLLGFLARLIGLGDVSGAIKNVITTIQEKVDKAIDAAIAWIVAKAKQLFGIKDKDDAADDASVPETAFVDDSDGEQHHISGRIEGGKLVATISSQTQHLEDFLTAAEKSDKFDSKTKTAQLDEVRKAITALQSALQAFDAAKGAAKPAARQAAQAAEQALAAALKALLSGVDLKAFDERYKLEGLVGTYGTMPKQSGDKLTPDHQPQAALVNYVADVTYDDPATGTRKLLFADRHVRTLTGGHANGAVAINLHENRHKEGLTYGKSVPSDVLADVSSAADTSGSIDKKQKAVIKVVSTRLKAEVAAMTKVADSHDYDDVKKWLKKQGTNEKKAAPLITKLKAQIKAGEQSVLSQDLAGWSS